jgi:hypothetical protein
VHSIFCVTSEALFWVFSVYLIDMDMLLFSGELSEVVLEAQMQEGVSRLERLALKEAEAAQQMAIRQASLLHAKKEAAAMEGVSWGMQEDAIVDDEEV